MISKFVCWFACFGLSFLIQAFGWTEQGKAFLFLDLGVDILFILIIVLCCLIVGDGFFQKFGLSIGAIIYLIAVEAIILFATWGATKLFSVDFFITYQIMTFGQCLCPSKKKND